MEENNRRNYGARNTIGFILIVLGGLFLLHSLDIIDHNIPHIIFSAPFALFAIGILILINSCRKILGAVMALVGGALLLERIFPVIEVNSGIIISIVVIGLGIYILFKKKQPRMPKHREFTDEGFHGQGMHGHTTGRQDYSINKDYIDDVAIFGGGERIVFSDNFKGGSITAIFGGSEINLNNCKLAEGTNIIDVLALFGGAEIRVPNDWNVIVNATPIFGGFSNKIIRDPSVPVDTTRTLVIKGLAMFGGIEVNSKPNFRHV